MPDLRAVDPGDAASIGLRALGRAIDVGRARLAAQPAANLKALRMAALRRRGRMSDRGRDALRALLEHFDETELQGLLADLDECERARKRFAARNRVASE